MEWGNPRRRQRTPAKRRLGRDMHSHKEPMNAVTDSRIGAELHRALRDNARHSHERSSRRLANFFFVLFLFGKEKGHRQTKIYRRNRRKTEHGISKQMNGGKDDGVGESEVPSAHPREAKARTGCAFPQRTDERSIRSFIGLCEITPGIRAGGQAA